MPLCNPCLHVLESCVIEHAFIVAGEADTGHRRRDAALTKPGYREIEITGKQNGFSPFFRNAECLSEIELDPSTPELARLSNRTVLADTPRVSDRDRVVVPCPRSSF